MIFIDEIKEQLNVMLHPSSAAKSRSVGDSLKYYYKLVFIPMIISLVLVYIGSSLLGDIMSLAGMRALSSLSIFSIMGLVLLLFLVIEPISLLINAAILQAIGGNLFKAFKGKYDDTFSAIVYASCSVMLFFWLLLVPILGTLILAILGIWSLIIEIIAIAKMHGTSRLAAFVIIIGSAVLIGIVADVLAFGLVALFGIGAFGKSILTSLASTCVAKAGYYCSNMLYSNSTGQLTVTIGQSTGANWTGWGVAYAANGTSLASNGAPNIKFYAMTGSLATGGKETVTFPASGSVPVGSALAGNIWVCYYTTTGTGVVGGKGSCTQSGGTGTSATIYSQIAAFTAKAA